MEDFGDILYVLVMLGALVFSAIRKSKQTKKRPSMPEPDRSSYDPMDEEPVIEDLRDLFRPKSPMPEPVRVKPKEVVKPIVNTPKEKLSNKKPAKPIEVINVDESDGGFEFDAGDIDLRKAVIYSEILNRPYQ